MNILIKFTPITIAILLSIQLCGQSSGIYEEQYNANSNDLPEWVNLLYSKTPNLKDIERAYDEYYVTHPFEKNEYTQYYKRWKRDKWQYADREGNVVMPTRKEEEASLKKYINKVQSHKSDVRAQVSQWEELGPWEYDHEATMNLSVQSPGSSHVWAMSHSASDQNVVFAGTVNAGIWKSVDKGLTWDIVSSAYPIRSVYSLEVDHSDSDIVYAHANGYIWKTTDGGLTWIKSGNEQYFDWTRDLIMHPTNNQIVIAATTNGLYRTANAGSSWTLIKGGHFQEIEFHPTQPNIVYIVKQISNRTELYKSIDGGLNYEIKVDGWPGISSYSQTGLFTACEFDASSYSTFSTIDLGSSVYPEFTIDMRVKSAGWSGDPSIMSNKNWNSGGNKGFIIAANGSGWKFNIGDGSNRIDLNGGTINDNEWHHIAVTYSATGIKRVYQDGSVISTSSSNITMDVSSGLGLAIAQDGTNTYGFDFPGEVSEVRIWSDTLTVSEIEDLACSDVDNTHPSYSDLIHYWKGNEGAGNVLIDTKGSNDGTIIGTSSWSSGNQMTCIESEFAAGEENKRVEIAVSPAAPNSIYVLATGSADGTSGLYGFYKSTNAGDSFDYVCCGTGPGGVATVANPNIVGYSNELTDNGGQYYYDLSLAVSPTDSNKIFAAGISVIRSEDGGQNWETNAHWVTWVGANTKQRYTHADVHDVKFFTHGNDVTLWTASDGGLYMSENEGDNFEPRMHGIQGTEFWGFGGSYKEDAMIGGTYHNGTLVHYNDTYPKGKYGKGGWFAGAAADVTKGYVHEGYGNVMFNEGGMFEIISRDVYWKYLSFDNSKNANQDRPGRYGNYAWHPHYYEEFYSPRDSVLYKTEDNGASWKVIHDFGEGSIWEVKVAVSNPDIIYVNQNHDDGYEKLWRTEDGGSSWADITPPDALVNNNNWRDKLFDIDLDDPDKIWVLLRGDSNGYMVFYSSDGGSNWSNISGNNLDGESVLDIVHQQGSDGGLYVGTTNSIYYKNNSMSDWILYNEGLPLLTRANYLYPYYTEGKIRFGSYRGAWERDFYEGAPPTVRMSVDKKTAECSRDTFYFKDLSYVQHDGITWAWTFEGGTPATSSLENPKVLFSEGSHDVTLTVTNSFGTQTQSIENIITVLPSDCEREKIPDQNISTASPGYVNLGRPDDFDFVDNDPFTFMAWIKPASVTADGYLLSKYDRFVAGQYQFGIENQKLIILREVSPYTLVGNSTIAIDEWQHVVATYDGSVMKLYLNGSLDGTLISTGSIGSISRDVLIGARYRSSAVNDHFDGAIEELSIWNKALSQEEIREYRHLTLDKVDDTSLIGYYQFNEENETVFDRANFNHGALLGAERLKSYAPLGSGFSDRKTVESDGVVTFGDTDVSIDFASGIYPEGEIVVTRIDLFPNIKPSTSVNARSYWVINNYGNNAVITDLSSITFSDIGVNTPSAFANDFKLFDRDENAESDTWAEEDNGDVYDVPTGSITYSTNLSISDFGQFSITNGKAKGWIGVVSTDWDNPANWGEGVVPGVDADVVIPADTPYQPIVNISTAIHSLIMMEGAQIMVEDGRVFEIKE